MKALQIANDFFGTTLYSSLFNALGDIGVANIIFVPVQTGVTYKEKDDNFEIDNGSSLIISQCFSSLDRLFFFSKQHKIYREIIQSIDINDVNISHAHTLFSAGYTAREIKRNFGIPYITAIRNVDLNIFFRKMKHLRFIGVNIMKDAEKIVFLSPSYKKIILDSYVPENLREHIARKSVVIPNGISDYFLKNVPDINTRKAMKSVDGTDDDKKKVRLIYAGTINRNKNIKETIDACKALIDLGYNCRYTVVGDITEKSCNNLLKESFIAYYPRCKHDELRIHYRNNDIFVMPSHTETFGLTYVEAMSQGLPVLYTREQGFDGYFKEGMVGYSVSDRDARELAEKILMIMGNYEEISKRCIESSKLFNWKIVAETYKDIYMNITEK